VSYREVSYYEPFIQKANLLTKNIEIGVAKPEQTKKNLFWGQKSLLKYKR